MGYDLQQAMHGNYSTLSALGYEAAVLLDEFDPTTCTGVVEASDEYISECSAESMLVITWGGSRQIVGGRRRRFSRI